MHRPTDRGGSRSLPGMFAVATLLLIALTFALLAYDTDRMGSHTVAAILAGEHGCLPGLA